MTKKNSVLIVGGGHVGLSFALLLAHHNIASTLLESQRYPTISPEEDTERRYYLDSRNTALSRKTVQIYQQIGLWEKLASHACRIDEVQISELGSFGKASLKKHEEGVESFGQVMENAHLGRQLLLAVKNNPLITLQDGTQVVDIAQDETSASVKIKTADDEQIKTLQASLVVACDGQHSWVRQLLNIPTKTHDYQQVGIVGVVQTDKPHAHIAIEKFSSAGPLALLPLTDGQGESDEQTYGYRRSVVFICPQGEQERYLQDDEYFLKTLQDIFGYQAGTFLQAGRRGAYPLVKVLAQRQVMGRFVIMGNAAHTLHPVAGQGFNLCLRDAYALAQMLSQIHNNQQADFGDYQALINYERSRLADQKRVIKFCDTVVNSFTHPSPMMKFARNVGLIAFDKIPGIKPLVASYAMGLKS